MEVLHTVSELRAIRGELRNSDIGFVPTMGCLHKGHLELIRQARNKCEKIFVSIFVNPAQFGPNEDFAKYPRTLEADLKLCEDNGVDYVFIPTVEEIYPGGKDNIVAIKPPLSMSDCLCGASRKGHFEGVLTVVLKLFNLIEPTQAFFGEKDYQQLSLIRAMKEDLNLNVEINGVPTIREESGLAMSSRNCYLSLDEKVKALELIETLKSAKRFINEGQSVHKVLTSLKKEYFEYFEARDPRTLQETEVHPMRLFIAAKIGQTRLIDNLEV